MKVIAKYFSLLLILHLALSPCLFAEAAALNPFAGFETIILPNGLKVWYKRMPGQSNAALSVAVRVGSDKDPVGKEQMAHFLEHLQFSDHMGLSTQDIKKQIDERGGVWNGSTSAERTFYFVRIKKEHALFALDWLYRVISPHEMKSEVVDRERYPVEVEVGAKPREFMDWVSAVYFNPPYLRLPGVWKREFGLETSEFRDFYTYRSLRSIAPRDLKEFYDRYYVPSLMTLTVIGDLDRDAVMQVVNATYATLRQAPQPPPALAAQDAGRSRSTFSWDSRSTISYSRRVRFATLTAGDELMLMFISRFLGKRLTDRLRFGEEKAVYGISAGLTKYGPAGYFYISGTIREKEFPFAQRVIHEEVEALRNASLSGPTFEAERSVLIQQLMVSTTTPESLESWAGGNFYDRGRHHDFPDVITAFRTFSQADVAAFVSRNFQPDREFNSTVKPIPISQGTLVAMAVALVFLPVRLMRWMLTRPVDMKRIRYVAHLRIPRLMYWIGCAAMVVIVAVGLRLLVFGFEMFSDAFLYTRDSIVLQWSVYALMAASIIALLVLALAFVPSKILVFDDRLLIKYVACRSVPIRIDELVELSLQRFPGVWLSRRLWKCVPFKWGVLSPGIYLRKGNGWSYFFDVRDREELLRVLQPPAL